MNYIKEMNSFYDWLDANPLTPAAITLWHTLMHINNRTGWRNRIAIARSEIQRKSGLGKTAYYAAREMLMKKGLITFKERGTKATVFNVIPFYVSEYDAREDKDTVFQKDLEKRGDCEDSLSRNKQKQDIHMSENQTSSKGDLYRNRPSSVGILSANTTKHQENLSHNQTFPKHIKTKQKETTQNRFDFYIKVIEFHKQHFGKLSPPLMEELMQWVDDVGEAMVIDAMNVAAADGNASWKHAKSFLMTNLGVS